MDEKYMQIKIFIDQGHHPQNPNAGAEGNGYREQDLVFDIGVRLANLLRANPDFDVRLSRNYPSEQLGTTIATSLAARVNAANAWGANYFISLHANASNITTASGCEGYVYAAPSQAFWFAQHIVKYLALETGLQNRGVFERPSLYVLRRTNMPATLIELGFITNPHDANLMANQPDLFAHGIYNGILSYFGMLPI